MPSTPWPTAGERRSRCECTSSWHGLHRAEIIRLTGVDDQTSFRILSKTGDVDPAVAARAGAACDGNPLALEQLAVSLSAAQRHGTADLPDVVPIGGHLAAVLADRLAELSSTTTDALAVLAAAGPRDRGGRRVLVQANRHGLANVEAFVHGLLGEVAWRRGHWIEARAESLIEHVFNEARPVPTGSFGHASLARVDAATGRTDDSRRSAALALDHGWPHGHAGVGGVGAPCARAGSLGRGRR